MKEFAPGIKHKDYPGNINKLRAGQLLDYVIQRHDSKRLHRDFRLGNPQMGMFSWALNTAGLPQGEGERIHAIRTNLHTHKYKDYEGVIPAGKYGAGRVSKQEEGKALITNADKDHFSFSLADKKHPERYALINPYQSRNWLLTRAKTPDDSGADKQHYKNITKEQLEDKLKNLEPGSEVQAKLDGALNFLNLHHGKAEMLSHRISKMTGKPVIQTERFFGKIPHLNLPKELHNSVLMAEVYGDRKGKVVDNQELGGILNSSVANALKTQKEKGVDLKALLFDVAKKQGKPVTEDYSSRKELLKQFLTHLPKGKFSIPEGAHTSEEAQKLYKQIESGHHPQTHEGIVIHPPHGAPSKYKIMPESDVWIKDFFDAEKGSKYEGKAVGGFQYSNEPKGVTTGRIGSGISDQMRVLMYQHPDWFIDRVARIKSHGKFPSGAHRVPVLMKGEFAGLHEDRGIKNP